MLIKTKKGISSNSADLVGSKDGWIFYEIEQREIERLAKRTGIKYESAEPSAVYLNYHQSRNPEFGEAEARAAMLRIMGAV